MNLTKKLIISLIGLSVLSSSGVITLGDTAAGFDLFLLSDREGGVTSLEIKQTKPEDGASNFNGILGIGANSSTKIQQGVFFGPNSQIYRHVTYEDYENKADVSLATVHALGVVDDVVNTANIEIYDFIDGLRELDVTEETPSGDVTASFEFETMTELTVMDLDSLSMNGGSITLEGRAGFDDMIVIRIAEDAIFQGGAAVNLVNLDRSNVIWLTSDDSKFDLHRNETANFEGIIINPTINDKAQQTIIGDVDFKGQVFAGSMKLGSGMDFQGESTIDQIPEPSGSFFLLSALAGTVFRRRR